jgi:hypothetical protein
MRWAPVTGMAIVAVASAVLARSEYLFRTRHALDLSKPISMSPGRVSTGEFGVDVSESYRIAIEFKKPTAIPSDTLDCLVGMAQWEPQVKCGGTHSVVNVKWTLYNGGSVVGDGSTEGGHGYWAFGPSVSIGGFHGEERHRYALELDILSDGSQLAPAEPQLTVKPASLEYYEDRDIGRLLIRLGTGSCILFGATLMVLAFIRKPRSK